MAALIGATTVATFVKLDNHLVVGQLVVTLLPVVVLAVLVRAIRAALGAAARPLRAGAGRGLGRAWPFYVSWLERDCHHGMAKASDSDVADDRGGA